MKFLLEKAIKILVINNLLFKCLMYLLLIVVFVFLLIKQTSKFLSCIHNLIDKCSLLTYNQRKHRRKSTEPKSGLSYAVRQAQVNIKI